MKKRSTKSGNNTPPSNEPKGRARRINNLENPGPAAVEGTGYKELLEAVAKKAGLTVDEWKEQRWPPLTEMLWAGGKERNQPGKEEKIEALVAKGLTAHDPLELLLMAIRRPFKPAEEQDELESAIRHAKKHLTGEPVPDGNSPPSNREEVCRAVAEDYIARPLGLRQSKKEQSRSALLKSNWVLTTRTL